MLYQNGWGVPQDNVRAYMWFTLAVEQDQRQGRNMLELGAQRDAIRNQLTPAQVAEALRLVNQCQTQQLKGC
ncbi:MAG: SEL1-like repeat protein [Nitrospiraceae bacterium]|nr:SEL1-like repeat protein [Nitrospira sp.]MCA9458226.1 SEL1-like repeat protein [Nitrospira sp.]MCB9774363.1 SEL1-like repeat protein [Nitrospiraceae bacterium]